MPSGCKTKCWLYNKTVGGLSLTLAKKSTPVLLNDTDPQTDSQFLCQTLTYYLRCQLGSLLLKQVFHLLDVELFCLCFIQLPFKSLRKKKQHCLCLTVFKIFFMGIINK